MAQRNLNKTIENVTVNSKYDITAGQLTELKEIAAFNLWEALRRAFVYGYEMGSRATKAEERQKAEEQAKKN